jgi:peroxiredoxin
MSATLVAVSPQSVEHNRKLIDARKLDFEILNDDDNAYAAQLGLKHGFPDDLKEVYGKFGINLDEFNGNSKWELAIPARFVVSTDGIIRAADFNADYTLRPEPSATIEALRSLG